MNKSFHHDGDAAIPEEPSTSPLGLLTTPQVAKFLHVSLKTVFNLRKNGLPYVQLGGAVRFDPQEIRAYLSNSRGLSSHRLRQIARKGATS
jgi:excisionase family DNA binding protein